MIVAIFDLDGTLYTGHMLRGVARHHRTHRTKRLYLYTFMATHMAMWPIWRLGLVSDAKLREIWARNMGWTVRGWTPQEAAQTYSWIAQEYVLPLVRTDVIARLRHHQACGHRTILVSGTFAPLLAEIGRQLNIEETVGTPLLMHNGRYSGASERPTCQGLGKWLRLKAHVGDDDIPWDSSYAYADSYIDLPLLEKVGHPVAVYPDPQLAAHAGQQGWEIIQEEPPTGEH